MKIDTKARVAIAAILDVAIHGTSQPVRVTDIAKRQRVSPSYLEHLFKKLRQNGIVAGFRGPGGGYRLKQRLAVVSVADVITAVDGDPCDDTNRLPEEQGRVSDRLWCRVEDHLRDYLSVVTLERVLANAMEAAALSERSAVMAPVPYVEKGRAGYETGPAAAVA